MGKGFDKSFPPMRLESRLTIEEKEEIQKALQRKSKDIAFQEGFDYKHQNPYHDKLEEFGQFVMRDEESEKFQGKWNSDVFERQAPLCVEIGTGYGHFMLEYCANNPEINFVGMDYRFKRSFNLARKLAEHPYGNFRYLRAKGERLAFIFGEAEVDRLFYFFPDPWRKKKHHKKRLFQRPFLEACYKVLKPGGKLYVKTDHDNYAEWMIEVMNQCELFDIELATRDLRDEFPEHFLASFQTKFEKIFLKKGEAIKAFVLTSKKES